MHYSKHELNRRKKRGSLTDLCDSDRRTFRIRGLQRRFLSVSLGYREAARVSELKTVELGERMVDRGLMGWRERECEKMERLRKSRFIRPFRFETYLVQYMITIIPS